jgi:hypothetical protein
VTDGFEIPLWIQAFVLGGIALVTLIVPAKILYELSKTSRDRTRRARDLADRLRERFGGVSFERGFFGPHRVRFTLEGRAAVVTMPEDDEVEIRLEPKVAPVFPFVARSRGAAALPFTFEGFRLLPLLRTFDPLIDESIAIYATGAFAGYVREAALDGLPAGEKPQGLAESLFVLRKLPGVRNFELRMSPSRGFRVRFDLRTEDLIHRPDELESVVHHAFKLYDTLVGY